MRVYEVRFSYRIPVTVDQRNSESTCRNKQLFDFTIITKLENFLLSFHFTLVLMLFTGILVHCIHL